jgi:hypothetical protein
MIGRPQFVLIAPERTRPGEVEMVMIANYKVRTLVLVLAILPFVADAAYAQSRRGGGNGGGRPAGGPAGARPAGGPGGVRPGGQVYTGGRYAVPRPPYRGHGYYGYPKHYGYGRYYGGGYYGYPAYPVYGYAPYYYGYPGFGFSVGFGYGGVGWGVGFGYGSPYGYYGYPYYGGHYGYAPVGVPIAGRPYGGVRLAIPERHASVTVDGYLVGTVDDFDGSLQQLNLERGTHRIEIGAPGFEPAQFEVNIRDGQTITYRSPLQRIP